MEEMNQDMQADERPQNNPTEEKTFTQEELNRIIGERLAKEKAKTEQTLLQKEQELNKRELSLKAKEVLTEKGLPSEFSNILNFSDEESLSKAIDKLQEYIETEKSKIQRPKLVGVAPSEGSGKPAMPDGIREAMALYDF